MPRIPSALLHVYSNLEEGAPAIAKDSLDDLLSSFNRLVIYTDIARSYLEYIKLLVESVNVLETPSRISWKLELLLELHKKLKELVEEINNVIEFIETKMNKIADELGSACKECEAYSKVKRAMDSWEKWKAFDICALNSEIKEMSERLRSKLEGVLEKLEKRRSTRSPPEEWEG